jgi:hypothetical protein
MRIEIHYGYGGGYGAKAPKQALQRTPDGRR